MDFTTIGSVNNYIKNFDMQQKWKHRQRTGNYAADGKKTMSEWLETQKNYVSANNPREDKDSRTMAEITNKLSAGERLTPSEMSYLAHKNPTMYKYAKSVESERDAYEQALKRCRTKDDVYKLRVSYAARAVSSVKSAMNNSSIPKEQKLEAVSYERAKMAAIDKAEKDFVKSGGYSRLPTNAERFKAERDLKKAREEERLAAKEKKAEEEERREAAAEKKASDSKNKTEKTAKKKRRAVRLKKARFTVKQAENTYEARKVRRANASAAYAEHSASAARAMLAGYSKKIDSRV